MFTLWYIISKVIRQLVHRPSCDCLTHGRVHSRSHGSAEHSTTTLLHPFNGLFSTTTWVSRYQKGKTSLDLKRGKRWRGYGMQWHQLGHMQTICTSLQTDNDTNNPSLNYSQAGCSSWRPTNSVKALKAQQLNTVIIFSSPTCGRDKQTNDWYKSKNK